MKSITVIFSLISIGLACNNSNAQETKIVVMNKYWAKEGKIEQVYNHRLFASEIRKKLGLAVGRVLLSTDV